MILDSSRIVIIGLSCRLAGANNPDEFWQLLVQGRSSISDSMLDQHRNNIAASAIHNLNTLKKGAYLENAGGFDASFFGISDDEAKGMDPQ